MTRGPPLRPSGDSGEEPLGRVSPVIPRWCCRLETNEAREAFWLSYGDDGLVIASEFIPTFMRLSTLLRRESNCELASTLSRLSKAWLSDGRVLDCYMSECEWKRVLMILLVAISQTGTCWTMGYRARSCARASLQGLGGSGVGDPWWRRLQMSLGQVLEAGRRVKVTAYVKQTHVYSVKRTSCQNRGLRIVVGGGQGSAQKGRVC
jgi:hypothetical protein